MNFIILTFYTLLLISGGYLLFLGLDYFNPTTSLLIIGLVVLIVLAAALSTDP